MAMSLVRQTVLDLLANDLFGAGRKLSGDVDWREVYEECRKQTVVVHGWNQARKTGNLPPELYREWEREALAAAGNHFRMTGEHVRLGECMDAAGIPYVILKGCASAAYYPRPAERILGDVDFLAERRDLERAGRILEEEGFRVLEEKHVHHIAYLWGNTEVEMHFAVGGIPRGKPGELVRACLADILEQAREIPVEGGRIRVPSDFHHGLNLLLHTNQHLLGEGIGLRHLCDWAVFAAAFSEEEFRGLFEEKLKETGLWRFAQVLTRAAVQYLGCPSGNWAGEAGGELAEALLEEIFEGGNFGRKQEGRFYESLLITTQGERRVSRRSMAGQLCASMNEMVRRRWPAAGKVPLLLPPGWIFLGGRYLLRIAAGRRPVPHPGRIWKNAARRRRRYRELGLFETEGGE